MIKEGDRVRCVKDDPMDEHCGVDYKNRWHIGEEFIVKEVEVKPWGTFLHDGKGHNLDIKRAKLWTK